MNFGSPGHMEGSDPEARVQRSISRCHPREIIGLQAHAQSHNFPQLPLGQRGHHKMSRITGVIASLVAAGHGPGPDDFSDGIVIVVRIHADHTAAGGGT
jgi:hypothetical protein